MSVFSVTVTYLRAFLRERHELALLGHEIAESTVRKYIDWSGKLSSPTWRTFLKNHAADTAAIDFFTVPTATFRVLFCFIVLDHVIILGESHLSRVMKEYVEYYHESRPHQSLDRNAPVPREIESASGGKVISIPHLGGLHHRYARAA